MKVQNRRSRRTIASLLVVPLVASGLTSLLTDTAFAAPSPPSRPSPSAPSRPSQPAPTQAPAKPSGNYGSSSSYGSQTTTVTPSRPAQPAPAPAPAKPSGGFGNNYYGNQTTTVTPSKPTEPAPAQPKTPDYSGGTRDAYKRNDSPATNPPAQKPADSSSSFGSMFRKSAPAAGVATGVAAGVAATNSQSSQPAQTPAPVFKYDIRPAPVAPAQKSVIPVPITGLPQPTVKTNSAPFTTFQGKAYQSAQSDGQGKVVIKNEVNGKATTFDAKTNSGSTTNKAGTVKKDFKQGSDGYVYNEIKFKGATGVERTKQYKTLPTPIATMNGGTRIITKYVPRDSLRQREIIYRDSSTMDYLLMYMLINQANQNNYRNSGGGYVGGYTGGMSAGGYTGDGVTIPAPPKIATGFDISWGDKFDIVPDNFHGDGTMRYTNPADAVAAYVSLDIINDNSEVPTFWGKVGHYLSFGMYDHKKNLKKFDFDSSARTPLTQQVTMMAADMLKSPEVDLKDVIDEKTGELKKDKEGNPVTYYFIVDPSNAMQVKDAETQATCNLAVASVVRPVEAIVTGDLRFMKVKVLSGGRAEGSCKTKQMIVIDQTDLEEMNNDLAAKIDEAIHAMPKMLKPVYN